MTSEKMGRPIDDLTGKTFTRLTVLGLVDVENGNSRYLCRCKCGETSVVWRTNLVRKRTRSCGCLQRERASQNMKHNNPQSK